MRDKSTCLTYFPKTRIVEHIFAQEMSPRASPKPILAANLTAEHSSNTQVSRLAVGTRAGGLNLLGSTAWARFSSPRAPKR